MSYCIPKILVNGKYFNVSKCKDCGRMGLYYKNLLIGFEQVDFECFASSFDDVYFEKYSSEFPDGKQHIVINSAHKDIQFTFTREEFQELKDILAQSLLLLQTHEILSK